VIFVRGRAGGTELTGTIYEPDEEAPTFRGAPDEGAPYTWVCDEFYEVSDALRAGDDRATQPRADPGGTVQEIDGRELRIAFESPLPRGFETREAALEAAREHVRTQFRRLGVPAADVAVAVDPAAGDEP